MGFDEFDDLLTGDDLELEAQFEALERRADIANVRIRAEQRLDDLEIPPDPLADLKGQLDRSALDASPPGDEHTEAASRRPLSTHEAETYLLVCCPGCKRINRLARRRALTEAPRCGACRASLVVDG